MDFESAGAGVFFIAPLVLANKGLHSCVRQLMCLQVTLSNELLAAQGALEGSLARVGAHVGFQISCLLKLLEATLKWTNEKFDLIFWALHFFNFYSA